MLVQEASGRRILFETGIGAFFPPKMRERFGVQESEHMLLKGLAAIGVSDADIDVVVLSHLHFDHAGGLLAAYREGAQAQLLFPKASFVVGDQAWQRAVDPHPRDRASFIEELQPLLEASGRLERVSGDRRAGIELRRSPDPGRNGEDVPMESWEEFAVVTGAAAAALTGLLFVAVSIRLEVIAASTDLRNRAAQTLTLFVAITMVAIVFAIPGQPSWLFGSELVLLAASGGITLFLLDRRARQHRSEQPVARLLDVLSPNLLTMTLIGIGGLLTAMGFESGLYLQVPAVIAALIGGVVGAWLLMMKTSAEPA
jgi:hypothetical protein